MGILRGLPGSAILVLLIVGAVTGCSQGEPKPNLSTVSPTATPSASPSASPSATNVPVNKIPPGNPASWVPSGVPTTAPYKEPGDVVPMFTQAMFKNTTAGALDAAKYYLEAGNWAYALSDATPFTLICDMDQCKRDAVGFAADRRVGNHVVGERSISGPPRLLPAPPASHADWVVQTEVTHAAGGIVDSKGKRLHSQSKMVVRTNLYLKWNGVMWRINADTLAS
jgi:hypothetical protein